MSTALKAVVLASVFALSSCKVLMSTTLQLNKVDEASKANVDIVVSENTRCVGTTRLYRTQQCFDENGKYTSKWTIEADIIPTERRDLVMDTPVSIYVGEGGTLFLNVGYSLVEYLKNVVDVDDVDNFTIEIKVHNNTDERRILVMKDVWVDGIPMDYSGAYIILEPHDSVNVEIKEVSPSKLIRTGFIPLMLVKA